ncbi:MAG TPA: carboxypeptidase-like regulatory domain-containing protein [Pseudonocardiaceae bacterium]|nr:carboxypeptidase-like regulatory domain-containing protein [Pseudonocardiaceae bacterium]
MTGTDLPPGFQPLRLCVSFDKASYRSNQPITVTVTITNVGTAPANHVELDSLSTDSFTMPDIDFTGGGPLNLGQGGVTIPVGATISATNLGYATDPATGFVEYAPSLIESNDGINGISIEGATAVAPVTAVFGNYTGTLFTSGTDTNAKPLPRQPLAGATVDLASATEDGQSFQATTDAQGRFTFTHLPGDPYFIGFEAPGGWIVGGRTIQVDDSGFEVNPVYLATRPLSESLTAAISFDDPGYAPGDTAHMTITLDNLTHHVIAGVSAEINPAGEGDVFRGGPGWAPFAPGGTANLPPGVSTFHVTDTVPADIAFAPGAPHQMFAVAAFMTFDQLDGAPVVDKTVPITGVTG